MDRAPSAKARARLDALASGGFAAAATTLREAIEDGATARELSTALLWHVRQLDAANERLSDESRRSIQELVAELT